MADSIGDIIGEVFPKETIPSSSIIPDRLSGMARDLAEDVDAERELKLRIRERKTQLVAEMKALKLTTIPLDDRVVTIKTGSKRDTTKRGITEAMGGEEADAEKVDAFWKSIPMRPYDSLEVPEPKVDEPQ